MKIIDFLASITILCGISTSLLFSFWILYPYKTIDFINQPFKVQTKEIESGGYLVYKIDYCKYSEIIPEVSISFVDGLIYTIPAQIGTKKEIGCYSMDFYLYVPKNLPKGEYHVVTTYRYKVNPIRVIDISTVTENFTVI